MSINDNTPRDAQAQSHKQRPADQEDRPAYQKKAPQEEARAYRWEKLTPEQRKAGEEVLSLIFGILDIGDQRHDDARNNPLRPVLPVIRDDHHSNVILIDGGRGSGKTSLMATILQLLEEDLEREQSSFKWSNPVIPVAFLDLHPLPESSHILLHLVGRLERTIQFLESLTSSSSRSTMETVPWKGVDRSELTSRQRWRELFEAVITWESNLRQRAANLDLDFYAWELGREEARRQGTGESFRNFIDALCVDMRKSSDLIFQRRDRAQRLRDNQPLFIIAVDDADLVPERSVEILDLLRKLWHPRLVFLLTGHSDQFLDLLLHHFLGVLRRPLAGIALTGEQEGLEGDIMKATDLAFSIYEKIIPPRHRCKIDDLSHNEKLERLEEQLKAASLQTDLILPTGSQTPQNLYYYFENEKYATSALPNRIRSFLNVTVQFDRIPVTGDGFREPHKGIARFVHNLWESLLRSEPLLNEDREFIRSVVGVDEFGMLFIEGLPLVCQYNPRRVRETLLNDLYPKRKGRLSIGRDHRLTVFRSRSRFPLSEPIKGALKLATDLVADIEDFYFVQDSPTPSGFNLAPVVVRWEDIDGYRPFRGFTWPLPDWHDFLSFTLFHQSWSSLPLEELPPRRESSDSHLEILARKFLNIVLTVAEERRTSTGDEILKGSFKAFSADVADKVVALAGDLETKRAQANSSWAYGRAGLLAAPESGLPSQLANTWLSSLKKAFGSRAWARARQQLRYERRQQIQERWDGPEPDTEIVEEILDRISAAAPEYHWMQEIEVGRTVPPTPPRSSPGRKPRRRKGSPGAG